MQGWEVAALGELQSPGIPWVCSALGRAELCSQSPVPAAKPLALSPQPAALRDTRPHQSSLLQHSPRAFAMGLLVCQGGSRAAPQGWMGTGGTECCSWHPADPADALGMVVDPTGSTQPLSLPCSLVTASGRDPRPAPLSQQCTGLGDTLLCPWNGNGLGTASTVRVTPRMWDSDRMQPLAPLLSWMEAGKQFKWKCRAAELTSCCETEWE